MKTITFAAFIALVISGAAQAQHQPYSGQHERDIKSLSQSETEQYLSGEGMGYAKAAELNHYPGPAHVLELADQLDLTLEQRAAIQQLMATHKAEARATGAKRVDAERQLDAYFRSGKADEQGLAAGVRVAAVLEGEYRLSHLETHRRLRVLLTDLQVKHYDQLRGYAGQQHSH